MEALENAVKHAGSQQALANLVGGGQTRISEWKRAGRVRAEAVIAVCRAVDWTVTPHQLRPDIYPNPHDGLPADLRAQTAEVAND